MDFDAHLSFRAIHGSAEAFQAQIVEIASHQFDRDRNLTWAENLRFLTPYHAEESLSQEITRGSSRRDKIYISGTHSFIPPTLRTWYADSKLNTSAQLSLSSPSASQKKGHDDSCDCYSCAIFSVKEPANDSYFRKPILRLTAPGEIRDCTHYLAISYCWQQPVASVDTFDEGHQSQKQHYVIRTPTGARQNRAPTSILDRAIAYAASQSIRLIWIDQECIEQNDPIDKELSIQAMDFVYQTAQETVAILNSRIDTIPHVSTFKALANRYAKGFFVTLETLFMEQVQRMDIKSIIEVAEMIASDPWHTRAWTLHESVVSSGLLNLLVPCDLVREKEPWLGSLRGQIVINQLVLQRLFTPILYPWLLIEEAVNAESSYLSPHFFPKTFGYQISTIFNCLNSAYNSETSDAGRNRRPFTNAKHAMAYAGKAAKAYRRFERTCPGHKWRTSHPSAKHYNALEACALLLDRSITHEPDRLAILANLCGFKIRLNTADFSRLGIGFSTSALTLALLNNDLSLLEGLSISVGGLGTAVQKQENIFSWLPPLGDSIERATSNIQGLAAFNPYRTMYTPRLSCLSLDPSGMLTLGFLFKVVHTVAVRQAEFLRHETPTYLRTHTHPLRKNTFSGHEHFIWASRFIELLNDASGPVFGATSLIEKSFWTVIIKLYNAGHIEVAKALYYERTGDTYPDIRSLREKGLWPQDSGSFGNLFHDNFSRKAYDWKTGLSECLKEDERISFCQLINGYECTDKPVPCVILSSPKSGLDATTLESTLVFVPYSNRIIRSEQYKKILWACSVKNLSGGSLEETSSVTKLRWAGSISGQMFPYLCGPAETLSADVAQPFLLI
jgi:hypothetical protein